MSFKKDLYNNATFEEFNISIGEDGKIIVTNNGIIIPTNKRKETLLRIAKRLKVGGTGKWNTDKLGLHIIIVLNNEQTIMAIREVMNQLLSKFNNNSNEPLVSYTYTQQRFMINQIFQKTSGKNYNQSSVMLRLIVIDSLYSTNAQYSYFSIEEMAKALYEKPKSYVDCEKYCAYTKDGRCNKFDNDGKGSCVDGIKLWLETEVSDE